MNHEIAPKAVAIYLALTAREVELLRFLSDGLTNQQITDEIGVSIRTVEYHRSNLMKKINARDRKDLVSFVNSLKLKPQ